MNMTFSDDDEYYMIGAIAEGAIQDTTCEGKKKYVTKITIHKSDERFVLNVNEWWVIGWKEWEKQKEASRRGRDCLLALVVPQRRGVEKAKWRVNSSADWESATRAGKMERRREREREREMRERWEKGRERVDRFPGNIVIWVAKLNTSDSKDERGERVPLVRMRLRTPISKICDNAIDGSKHQKLIWHQFISRRGWDITITQMVRDGVTPQHSVYSPFRASRLGIHPMTSA
jgi:hypothetical protein